MIDVAPFPIPTVTLGSELGSEYEQIDINYDNLLRGLHDLNVAEEVYSNTAIHIADLGATDYLGVSSIDDPALRLLSKLPFLKPDYMSFGFQAHQMPYMNKIVLNVSTQPNSGLDKEFSDRLDMSPRKLSGLTQGDFFSLVLAHEFAHMLPGNAPRLLSRREAKVESKIDAYIANCINLNESNPWKSVINI